MKVVVNNHAYKMSEAEARKLRLQIAEDFGKGIYAVRKKGFMELRNDHYKSKKKMLEAVRVWNSKGFIVSWNW